MNFIFINEVSHSYWLVKSLDSVQRNPVMKYNITYLKKKDHIVFIIYSIHLCIVNNTNIFVGYENN